MDVISLIGRILFTFIFLGSAIGHLTSTAAMAGYAQGKGVPRPRLAVMGSGIYMIVAGVLIILGLWADLAALALVLFLLLTAFVFHAFWRETDTQSKMQEQIQFQKDISLAGGALVLFALYAGYDPGLSVVGALF